MTIYLMRHGQSTSNVAMRLAGRTDVALTDVGRRQAMEAGRKLKGIDFSAVYTSPLIRARETAALAAPLPARVVEDLQERSMGLLENLTWDEAEAFLGTDRLARWFEDPVNFTPPEGESIRALYERGARAVAALLERHGQEDTILLVSHGAILSCITAYLLGQGPEAADRYTYENCGVACIDVHEGVGRLRLGAPGGPVFG